MKIDMLRGLLVVTVLALSGALATAGNSPDERRVMVTPVLFPASDAAVAGPPANDIRQAYKNVFDPFWTDASYDNYEVVSKTYGYMNVPWPKNPLEGATGGPDFDGDGERMTGAGEPFTEEFSMGGNWLVEDGIWTPGERFRDANGDGEYTFADPWTDVQAPHGDSNDGVWDEHGERFVDINDNGQYDAAVNLNIYDRNYDLADGYEDGMAGDPTAGVQLVPANRSVLVDELHPNVAILTAYPGIGLQGSDIQAFDGDYSTQIFDRDGIATETVQPPNGVLDSSGDPIATNGSFTVRTYEVTFDAGNGTNSSSEVNTEYPVYEYVEPYTDADDNGEWTDREAYEDFLVRWDAASSSWIPVTNQYMFDNYPPVMDGTGIYDVGAAGAASAGGFGPYPGTVAGNGIADNIEYLMLRSGDGGAVDVDHDGTPDATIAGPNGLYDGPEEFTNNGNTKMQVRQPGAAEREEAPPPANWDPHNFYANWQNWWQQTFGTPAPSWPAEFLRAEAFDPETERPFDATVEPLAGDPAGGIYPDSQGYYDGAREFRDLPSSMYHVGGDLRLGERTSPTSASIWGEDIGNNMPPLDYTPDFKIEAAGPFAYNVHGENGWDAGNQLTIELLTWRTDGRSLTDSATSSTTRRGGWAGLDAQDRWCRDGNLDGLVDQGEAPDDGFHNYITDADPMTNDAGGGDAGRNSNYPFNYQRLYEDIVAAWDQAEDFTLFSDTGNQVDYLAVIYPGGYAGTDFAGASGQKHSDSMFQPYVGSPLINGAVAFGGILTRDSRDRIRFGGQVRNMGTASAGGGAGATGDYAIPIMAHEAAHDWLGAPDLYDYDTWNGILYNNPIGANDLMAGGGLVHFVGPLKDQFGWVEPKNLQDELTPGAVQQVQMYPIEARANQYYRFARNSNGESLWFWYENNQSDVPLPKVSGPGIHVLHEDRTPFGNAVPKQQRINDHFTWQMVQADGLNQLQDNINSGDAGDPFPGSTDQRQFNKHTSPPSVWWDDTETGIEILDISLPQDAHSPATVTFRWIYRDVPELTFLTPPGGHSVGSQFKVKYSAWDREGNTTLHFYRDTDPLGYDGSYLGANVKIAGDQEDNFSTALPNVLGSHLYFFHALLVPNTPSQGIGNLWTPASNSGSGSVTFPTAPTISPATVNPADNAAAQKWTLTATTAGGNGTAEFALEGSVSGALGTVTAGLPFSTGTGNYSGNFTLTINSTLDYEVGDLITFRTTGWTEYSDALLVVDGETPADGGSLPANSVLDTDGDNMDDIWEFDNFGSLEIAGSGSVNGYTDTDGDGLNDYYEFLAGTDPNNPSQADLDADSDSDGLSNGTEQRLGTNPGTPDTDDDGLYDGDELAYPTTSPTDAWSPHTPRSFVLQGSELRASGSEAVQKSFALLPSGEAEVPDDEEPDAAAPALTISSPPANLQSSDRFIDVSGTVTAESPISSVDLYINEAFTESLELDATGAFDTTVIISSGTNTIEVTATDDMDRSSTDEVTVIGTFQTAAIRVTQTWDANGDLDTWLIDPQGRHQGFTGTGPGFPDNAGTGAVIPGSELDIDDVSGTGPENITLEQGNAIEGEYEVWVNNFSHSGTPNSMVRVLVDEGGANQRFVEFGPQSMPVSDGNGSDADAWWHVTTITWPSGEMDPAGTPVPGAPGVSPGPGDGGDGGGGETIVQTIDPELIPRSYEGWTIEAWLRPGDTNQSGSIASYAKADGTILYQVGLDQNHPVMRVRSGLDTTVELKTSTPLPQGEWSHVAYVYSEEERTLRLHVNGLGYIGSQMPAGRDPSQGSLLVDTALGGQTFTNAHMDELRLWSRARNSAMIAEGIYDNQPYAPNIVAGYSFDDGGLTIEDFVHPDNADYRLGGDSLPNQDSDVKPGPDGSFGTADDIAAVAGTPDRHNDYVTRRYWANVTGNRDEDGDGIPDWWDDFYFDGEVTATGDSDADGLTNLYEFWCQTNPLAPDTDGDGTRDGFEDFDGDWLTNAEEQLGKSDPRRWDTDNDGIDDGSEVANFHNPGDALIPRFDRAIQLDGSGFVRLPNSARFARGSWTIEGWVKANAAMTAEGAVLERQVANGVYNYRLGITAERKPFVEMHSGANDSSVKHRLVPDTVLPERWVHLAASFDDVNNSLHLYINGTLADSSYVGSGTAFAGSGIPKTRIGSGIVGWVDEVRIWRVVRTQSQIQNNMSEPFDGAQSYLVSYFHFDDGPETVTETLADTDFDGVFDSPVPDSLPEGTVIFNTGDNSWYGSVGAVWRPTIEPTLQENVPTVAPSDWLNDWSSAGKLVGGVKVGRVGSDAPVIASRADSDGDGLPDWWEKQFFGTLSAATSDGDPDGDGLTNAEEYQQGTNPLAEETAINHAPSWQSAAEAGTISVAVDYANASGQVAGNSVLHARLETGTTGVAPVLDPDDGDVVFYEYRWLLDSTPGNGLDDFAPIEGQFSNSIDLANLPEYSMTDGYRIQVQITPFDQHGFYGPSSHLASLSNAFNPWTLDISQSIVEVAAPASSSVPAQPGDADGLSPITDFLFTPTAPSVNDSLAVSAVGSTDPNGDGIADFTLYIRWYRNHQFLYEEAYDESSQTEVSLDLTKVPGLDSLAPGDVIYFKAYAVDPASGITSRWYNALLDPAVDSRLIQGLGGDDTTPSPFSGQMSARILPDFPTTLDILKVQVSGLQATAPFGYFYQWFMAVEDDYAALDEYRPVLDLAEVDISDDVRLLRAVQDLPENTRDWLSDLLFPNPVVNFTIEGEVIVLPIGLTPLPFEVTAEDVAQVVDSDDDGTADRVEVPFNVTQILDIAPGDRFYCQVYAMDAYGNQTTAYSTAPVTLLSSYSDLIGEEDNVNPDEDTSDNNTGDNNTDNNADEENTTISASGADDPLLFEPNGTFDDARRILPKRDWYDPDTAAVQIQYMSSIEYDVYWFYVPYDEGYGQARVRFETNNGSAMFSPAHNSTMDAFDTRIELFDAQQNLLGNAVDDVGMLGTEGSSLYARIDRVLTPGLYFVRVSSPMAINSTEFEYYAHLSIERAAGYPPPTAPSEVTLTPSTENVQDDDDLVCTASGSSSALGEGAITYRYIWEQNGRILPFGGDATGLEAATNYELIHSTTTNRLSSEFTKPGDTWVCSVYATDTFGLSRIVASQSVEIPGDSPSDESSLYNWSLALQSETSIVGEETPIQSTVGIGWTADATNGFDPDYDSSLADIPPVPGDTTAMPAGTMYSLGQRNDHLVLNTDFRPAPNGGGYPTWYLRIDFGTQANVCTIRWNSETAAQPSRTLFLTEVSAHGDFHPIGGTTVDMSEQSQITVRPNGERFKVYRVGFVGGEASQTINLVHGWNLISLALLPSDNEIEGVFADDLGSVKQGPIWAFRNGTYRSVSETTPLEGYWLYCPRSEGASLTVRGDRISTTTLPLDSGWNLLGFATDMLPSDPDTSNLDSILNDADLPQILKYRQASGSYLKATGFESGEAYWIYSEVDGKTIPARP